MNKTIHTLLINRKWLMIAFIITLIGLGMGVPKFGIDASSDSILLEGDDSLKFSQKIIKRYGSGDIFTLGYIAKDGDVFSENSIDTIDQLTQQLSTLDGVKSVISITNIPLMFSPKGDIQTLIREPRTLLTKGIDIDLAKQEIDTNPLYSNTLVSADKSSTVIILNLEVDGYYLDQVAIRDQLQAAELAAPLLPEQAEQFKNIKDKIKSLNQSRQNESRGFVEQVETIADDHRDNAKIVLGGATMITINMIDFVKQDMQIFGLLILLIVTFTLWILFRQWQMVFLSLVSCLSIIVMMVGLLGWLNWKVTLISSNFMIFLFIISLATCIHLLIRFRECYEISCEIEYGEHKYCYQQSIEDMLKRMWRPCLYNMITTVIAFMSLVVSGIRPVIDFGWIMSIGVLVSLIVCLLVIPIGLSLFPNLPRKQLSTKQGVWLSTVASFVQRQGFLVFGSAIIVSIIAITGALKIDVENRFIDFFKSNTSVAQSMTLLDTEFGGTMPFDIILMAPKLSTETDNNQVLSADDEDLFEEDDLFEDEDLFDDDDQQTDVITSYWWSIAGLQQIEQLHDFLEQQPEIGKTYSLATGYKLTRDLLDITLTDVELSLLRQQLGDLEDQILKPYLYEPENQTRISMRVHETSPNLNRSELIKRIEAFTQNEMKLQPDQLQFTGLMWLYNNMLQSLFNSQIVTLGTVFLAILLAVAFLFRSLLLAAVAVAPNMIAALLVLGIMGHLGISLDFMTITIAAITIGIGIDYAIHYIYRFRHEVASGFNCTEAVAGSHQSIGRSLVFSALTIVSGFSVLYFSNFIPSVLFAILTSIAMLSALVGVLTLVPRLLMLICPTKIAKNITLK